MTQFSNIDLSALDGSNGFKLVAVPGTFSTGFAVASAGDLNRDGFDDFLLTCPAANLNGAVYVVYGSADRPGATFALSSLDGSNGYTIDGPTQSAFGSAISAGGDVNGDGYTDMVVSAVAMSVNAPAAGSVYVLFGSATGFATSADSVDGTNGFRIDGLAQNDSIGRSVSLAGDVNGDGFADAIINQSTSSGGIGSAWVVFGKASGFAASIDLSDLDGNNGFRIDAPTTAQFFSPLSVASVGDVNGDGIGDIVIGNPNDAAGHAYLIYGTASGFGATFDVSTLNGSNGRSEPYGAAGDSFGRVVAAAGDVNADGLADFIVGAPGANPDGAGAGSGEVFVFYGAPANVDFPQVSIIGGYIHGPGFHGIGRYSVASAGDVNGDGFGDIIIGNPTDSQDTSHDNQGISYVVFGSASGIAVSSVSALDGNNGFSIFGELAQDGSGKSVSSAGDVNGDGFDDLLVGASSANTAYIIYGHGPDTAVTRTGTAIDNKILGGAFDDTLNGLGGNDTLIGGAGNDTLNGGIGNDTAAFLGDNQGVVASLSTNLADGAGTGHDTLSGIENLTGGNGDDTLTGNAAANTLSGLGGNDQLFGGGGNDALNGDAGNDKVNGQNGDDVLHGGAGNDNLIGVAGNDQLFGDAGDDSLKGGDGNDLLDGGAGSDTANYANAHGAITVDLVAGTASGADIGSDTLVSIENVSGASGDDTISGDAGANNLAGNNGDDLMNGLDGNDTLDGGSGNDALSGGNGDDVLTGGKGNNVLDGGDGNDILKGGTGNDAMIGGAGIDTVDFSDQTLAVVIDLALNKATGTGSGKDNLSSIEIAIGGSGDDTINGAGNDDTLIGNGGIDHLNGAGGNDALSAGAGNDVLSGGDGDDTLNGGADNDAINGGNGIDTADFSGDGAGVNASLATNTATGTQSGSDTFSSIENISGGNGDDGLTGDSNANFLNGGSGNDAIDGGAGNDTMLGGNDNDLLLAGAGDDTMDGGDGTDSVDFSAITVAVTANLAAGTASSSATGNDTLSHIENLSGGSANDTLTGDADDNTLAGNSGNDTLIGGAGNDLLSGGAGIDTADFSGDTLGVVASLTTKKATGAASGTDTLSKIENLTGGSGNDTLTGDANANVLSGGAGNDVLNGTQDSAGDTLLGGDGDDTLVGTNSGGIDILDGGNGIDTADFSTWGGANINLASGTAFNSTLVSIENVIGNGTITGDSNANVLTGGFSADTLNGAGGNDTLNGGDGNDVLDGGSGNDILHGGLGSDQLRGSVGDDTLDGGPAEAGVWNTAVYTGDAAGVVANLATGMATGTLSGNDTLIAINALTGGAGNDTFIGDATDNQLSGGGGDDTLTGAGGNDTLDGGTGVNTLDISSDTAGVTVTLNGAADGSATGALNGTDIVRNIQTVLSGSGNDTLNGDANANTLTGNGGNDTLRGGGGADLLDGGLGKDVFVYNTVSDSTGAGYDTVNGFDTKQDAFDTGATIMAIDAALSHGALSTASFDSDLAATVTAARLGASHALLFTADSGTLSGQTFLVIDSNGTAGYQAGQDLVIHLTNIAHIGQLATADFI